MRDQYMTYKRKSVQLLYGHYVAHFGPASSMDCHKQFRQHVGVSRLPLSGLRHEWSARADWLKSSSAGRAGSDKDDNHFWETIRSGAGYCFSDP